MIPFTLLAFALVLALLAVAHRVAKAQTAREVGRSHNAVLWIAVFIFVVVVAAIGFVEFFK